MENNDNSNSNLEARLEGLSALLDSPNMPMGVFFCSRCSKTFASPHSLGGHQNAHKKERDAERFQSLIERTDLQIPPADDSSANASDVDDHDHQFPVLSPLPISFIPPPPSNRRSFIPHLATRLEDGDPFQAFSRATERLRAFQDRLRDRFRSYNAETQDTDFPSIILDDPETGHIPFGIPPVPAEDNNDDGIRSEHVKLEVRNSLSDDSDENGTEGEDRDESNQTTENSEGEDETTVHKELDLTLKL